MALTMIAVCDENKPDGQMLEKMLREILPGTQTQLFESEKAFLRTMEKKKPLYHAIFLGIGADGESSLEAAKKIREYDMFVPLILVSDTDSFYRQAFAVFAFNYIQKPVVKENLKRILQPLKCKWEEESGKTIHFSYRSQVYTIPHSKVNYISSSLHTVNFHLTDKRTIQCRGKLDDFTGQLEDSLIIRCHQSFFVNMEKITFMRNDSCILGDEIVPISRSYGKSVHKKYQDYIDYSGKNE